MEMFIGNGDNQPHKQKYNKPYSKFVNNADGPDVELLFFKLIDMSYDDLLDMYNDYTQMYAAFKDNTYQLNAKIVMGALKVKRAKEVNVS